jgi:hypothetical protein
MEDLLTYLRMYARVTPSYTTLIPKSISDEQTNAELAFVNLL